jgi:hypothetical protein
MDPITIAMGLAQFVPQIAKWVTGSDKAAEVAQKAVDIAQVVTGKGNGDEAIKALQADPALVLQYRKAVLDQEVTFEQLAVQNAADINKSMQAEAAAEHWPTYSWRPAIGFAVAIDLVLSTLVVFIAYAGVMFFNIKPEVLAYLPAMLGAMAALIGVASPILGIASWFRGKMQADPTVPTTNRG